jgi:putative tricarboxylic transport membrane protein
LLEHLKFPVLPVILGLILGDMAETQFRMAVTLSQGSPWPFFTRPISAVLLVVSVLSLVLPFALRDRAGSEGKKEGV